MLTFPWQLWTVPALVASLQPVIPTKDSEDLPSLVFFPCFTVSFGLRFSFFRLDEAMGWVHH